MDKELKLKFLESLDRMQGKDYLASLVAFCAAPTVKGKKPSSLITFGNKKRDLLALWQKHKEEVCRDLDIEFFELKQGEASLTVLLFRRTMLEWYVSNKRNLQFLHRAGYEKTDTLEQKLELLKKRFEQLCPHEVGIFLGIPVEDVEGFIEHKGKNCLMCRYWKVYGNCKHAELLFRSYDTARSSIANSVVNFGGSITADCIYRQILITY